MLNDTGSRERPCSASCAQATRELPEGRGRNKPKAAGTTISQDFIDEIGARRDHGGIGLGAHKGAK